MLHVTVLSAAGAPLRYVTARVTDASVHGKAGCIHPRRMTGAERRRQTTDSRPPSTGPSHTAEAAQRPITVQG